MRPPLKIPMLVVPLGLALISCSSTRDSEPPGSVRVIASTTGGDLPVIGYQISVDGSAPRVLIPNTALHLGPLSSGSHEVRLTQVPENCDLTGAPHRTIQVTSGGTTSVDFSVICYATGIEVQISTVGEDPGASYLLQVGPALPVTVSRNARHLLTRLVPGEYSVVLGSLPGNCSLVDGPPPPVPVLSRQVSQVILSIQCLAQYGILEAYAYTTGSDPDQDGYLISAVSAGIHGVFPNEAARFRLLGGTYSIRISDVAPNCQLLGPSTQEALVKAGGLTVDTNRIAFNVACSRTEKIAFVEGDLILVTYSDGTTRTHLGPGAEPEWSPNGGSLVYHGRNCPGWAGLQSGISRERWPLSNYSGDWPPPLPCVDLGLQIASQPPRPQIRSLTLDPRDHDPAWSPDGGRIAFERAGVLWVINADGTRPLPVPVIGVYRASAPSWSPDGTRLVFTCEFEHGNEDLCIVDVTAGGVVLRLTSHPGPDHEPDWGPHGGIAFTTTRFNGREDIAIIEPTTGEMVRVAAGRSPSWSGDGSRIAFSVLGLGISTIHPDGSSLRVINYQAGNAPSWRP